MPGLVKTPSCFTNWPISRVQVETSKMLSYRVGWMQDQGLQPNMEASMAKLFATELEQRVGYAAMEVTGLYGQALPRSSRALLQGVVPRRYMGNIPSTIAAGSSEINRNIMATAGPGVAPVTAPTPCPKSSTTGSSTIPRSTG